MMDRPMSTARRSCSVMMACLVGGAGENIMDSLKALKRKPWLVNAQHARAKLLNMYNTGSEA